MLTGKQKRFLRALGVNLDVVLMVGKGGVTDATAAQAREALLARELIKGRVLDTSPQEPDEAAAALADAIGAELVQVIGRNFLLYQRHPEEPRIELPR